MQHAIAPNEWQRGPVEAHLSIHRGFWKPRIVAPWLCRQRSEHRRLARSAAPAGGGLISVPPAILIELALEAARHPRRLALIGDIAGRTRHTGTAAIVR